MCTTKKSHPSWAPKVRAPTCPDGGRRHVTPVCSIINFSTWSLLQKEPTVSEHSNHTTACRVQTSVSAATGICSACTRPSLGAACTKTHSKRAQRSTAACCVQTSVAVLVRSFSIVLVCGRRRHMRKLCGSSPETVRLKSRASAWSVESGAIVRSDSRDVRHQFREHRGPTGA